MTDKLSPEDLAVWWQAYWKAMNFLSTRSWDHLLVNNDEAVFFHAWDSASARMADNAFAQYKARREPNQ